ncbi:FecR domain-containing protein [Chitinophaga filiformis]|uniref:FecR family protein n=1 Tax=Chitinophaga filiformis TaxID=104663 RepID=UPI001F3B4F3E|nr:FecR domain-containing protein [Chitinophaga filiformis]MCF6405089.1 FecR domain-containing protein [Chitinophaga filiformis]
MKNINLKTEALIIAEITGSITSEERAELQELMRTSSEVRELSEHMHKILDPQISEIRQIRTTSAEKIIDMGNAQLHKRGRIRRMVFTALAAACFVGMLATALYYFGQKSKTETLFAKGQSVWLDLNRKVIALNGQGGEIDPSGSFVYNKNETLSLAEVVSGNDSIKLIVPWGREYTIKLNDGTLVHMNSGSVLSWKTGFGKAKREVSLRGEAFLKVAENPQMPFIVHLQNEEVVEVLGTSFNVKAYNEQGLQVSLFTGSVHVKGKGGSVNLKPGQEVVYKEEHLQVQSFNALQVEKWRERVTDLPDAGIADIKKAVIRIYGENVEFDPAIGDRRARVSIDRDLPVEVFLKQYALVNDLNYSNENGVHRLSLPGDK